MIGLSKLARVLAALGIAALLSACTISSKDVLVTDSELATPLPTTVYAFGYDQDAATDPYIRSKDIPGKLTLEGKAYVSDDDTLAARFVPLDAADTYLFAATLDGKTTYGIAHYEDSLLEIRAVFGKDAEAAFKAAALPGVTTDKSGITVADRAALDAVIAMVRGGSFEVLSLALYISDDKDAVVPTTLVRDGSRLKAAD